MKGADCPWIRGAGREGIRHSMSWLHTLPDYLVFPIVVVPLAAAVAAAPYLRHALLPRRRPPPFNSEMMDGFIALASSAAVLLTFSLVQAEGTFRHVEEQVAKEAAAMNDLDRTLTRYGDPRFAALRVPLRMYGEAIAGEEWELLHHGGQSKAADAHYLELSKSLRGIEPETHRQQLMYAEALRQLDDLSDLREERIEAAEVTLPAIYWFTALSVILLMILISAGIEPTPERTLITVIIASAIGVLAALVIVFDAPFQGGGSISADPFRHALAQMAERT